MQFDIVSTLYMSLHMSFEGMCSLYAKATSLSDSKPQLVIQHLVGGVRGEVHTVEASVGPAEREREREKERERYIMTGYMSWSRHSCCPIGHYN